MIRDIEALTGRRLIVYFANRFENGQIDQRDCMFFTEILGDVGDAPLDLMVETNGGETDASEAVISLIQSTVDDLRVVIPNAAKSNGTLIALAGRSIVMGPASELGPIEPAVNRVPCSILLRPEVEKSNLAMHMYGVYALQQTKALASKLLKAGMMSERAGDVDATVEALASRDRYSSHGSVIDHKEAANLGLKVEFLPAGNEIWQRLWLLYCMYQHDSEKAHYLKVFEGNARSTAIAAPPLPSSVAPASASPTADPIAAP
jgi:hypothetical protein